MVFKSRIDWAFKISLLVVFIVGLIGAIGIYFDQKENSIFPSSTFLLFILCLNILLFILGKKTDYTFEEKFLMCRSWIFKKKIDYKEILKIERGTTLYAGWKLAAASKGIIITYKGYNDIYISPEREAEFIALLLEKNPAINVKLEN